MSPHSSPPGGAGGWLRTAAQVLAADDLADSLPLISSKISSQLEALGGGPGACADDYLRAIESLATAYAAVVEQLLGRAHAVAKRPPSVLSLCTGYDAAAEVRALHAVFGRLTSYVSIERDPAAVRCNRAQLATLPPTLGRVLCVEGDVRSPATIAELNAQAGPFDLAIALRPPVTATAYADERRRGDRAWLSDRVDPPVMLDLIAHFESDVLASSFAAVFFTASEAEHLSHMLRALGYGDYARGLHAIQHGLHEPPWHALLMT